MPAATTHALFAEEVLKRLSPSVRAQITDRSMFFLGSQGPDLLLFSKASVLPGSLSSYGSRIHHEKQDVFMPFFEKYSETDPDLHSYFLGFLCHYALDRCVHPLVDAAAKIAAASSDESAGIFHVTMEAEIDVWMLHQRGRTIDSYDVYKVLKIKPEQKKKIAAMFDEMFRTVYQLQFSRRTLEACCTETYLYSRLLAPNKVKYRLFRKAEDLMGIGHRFSGMMLNNKAPAAILNLEKKALPLAHDNTQTISASYPELYGKALQQAVQMITERREDDFILTFEGR